MSFERNLEELLFLGYKHKLYEHLKKNYKENIHYIINYNTDKKKGSGGHNKISFMLTEEAFELLKNSYNLRNRYIVDINDNIKQVNIGMCIENQTIGFIENTYNHIFTMKRQYMLGSYRLDLYFIDKKLVIECDENNHNDRDPEKEKKREEYILSLGNQIIRYNPNEKKFDLSNVLRQINGILFCNI
jgi:very-short-patch-repair endonuclease